MHEPIAGSYSTSHVRGGYLQYFILIISFPDTPPCAVYAKIR